MKVNYDVQLTYPRTTKQAVYAEVIEAETQAEAILTAETRARHEGWKGAPIKCQARPQRSQGEA